jgi:outer membrane immunogenic protein
MKKAGLTLMISFAFSALLYAGPEALSSKEMKQVAPVVTPTCPNWSGFYVGALGGFTFGTNDIKMDLDGDWPTIPGFDRLEAANSRDLDMSGAEVGGLLGYNYQLRSWVFGLEASGSYLWLRDSNHFENVTAGAFAYHGSSSLKTHYLATVGPRIGYAFCKWLPYVTGGVAIGDIDFRQDFFTSFAGVRPGQSGSTDETNVGWMVGGGLEYALTNHWRMRGQYQYVDLGSADFNSIFVKPTQPNFSGHHEASLTEHNVSFALMYGF